MADFFLYLYGVCLPRYSWWFVPSSRDWGTVPRPKTLASSQLAISWSVTLVSAGQQHCGSRTRQGSGTRGHRRHTGGLSCSASQNYSKMYIIVLNRLLFTSVQYSRHHVSVMRLNPIGKLGFCPGATTSYMIERHLCQKRLVMPSFYVDKTGKEHKSGSTWHFSIFDY